MYNSGSIYCFWTLLFFSLTISVNAYAQHVGPVNIDVYVARAQSNPNEALYVVGSPAFSGCTDFRAYISNNSRELMAFALSSSFSGKKVLVSYQTGAPVKVLEGHGNIDCQITTIYRYLSTP